MSKGWIGVDVDGTLAHYDGWKGIDHIGEPLAPMVERVKRWLAEGIDVRLFTARASNVHALLHLNAWCKEHIGVVLPVTNVKDFEMVCLYDDRCVQVEQNTGKLATVLGATGEFPDGKISDDDEGELRLAVTGDQRTGNVIIDFGKPVVWMALPAEQAVGLAEVIAKQAEKAKQ